MLGSCARPEATDAPESTTQAPAGAQPVAGPHALVYLKDGSKVPGAIVASSQTDLVVAGDDGIERKIPLAQVKSVEYGEPVNAEPPRQAARETARPRRAANEEPPQAQPKPAPQVAQETPRQAPAPSAAAPSTQPPPATRTYELPAGNEISVRTNEAIDSATAAEGQTFDAQVTRDAKDSDGAVVIPRGSGARVVIKSASKGGRFRGASDLVLDLQSVIINGRSYNIDTVDVSRKGKAGVGANRRTAEYAGGGAALGAVIGAIAGGGRGAAIGAGAGAGAGALTQILTKGGAIKVPVESVLTFSLDKPLRVAVAEKFLRNPETAHAGAAACRLDFSPRSSAMCPHVV
jgi:hypothetical protein